MTTTISTRSQAIAAIAAIERRKTMTHQQVVTAGAIRQALADAGLYAGLVADADRLYRQDRITDSRQAQQTADLYAATRMSPLAKRLAGI